MKMFFGRTKGSITVFVTLILVPTIFFTGFMTDLARIKLYSSQAVMAADNYGETVLSQYDNLLKELYGLFAVTQDEEGKKAIEDLKKYMEYSFHPDGGGKDAGSGFMPYQSAQIELDYEAVPDAVLSNEDVFATQIGDFMKFRIAQQLMDEDNLVLDALDEIQGAEESARAAQTKMELDEKASDALEQMKPFYEELNEIQKYPAYIDGINAAIKKAIQTIQDIISSDAYRKYADYVKNADAIEAALAVTEESRSDADRAYLEILKAYQEDESAHEEKLRQAMSDAIDAIGTAAQGGVIHFRNFGQKAENLYADANLLADRLADITDIRAELEQQLNHENVSPEYREKMKQEISMLDELSGGGRFCGDHYVAMADDIRGNIPVNQSFESQAQAASLALESIMEDYLDAEEPLRPYPEKLEKNRWLDFQKNPVYETIYQSLKKCFESENEEAVKRAKSMKKDAENRSDEFNRQMKEGEETDARNIPEGFHFNQTKADGIKNFKIANIFHTISAYFSKGSLGAAGRELLSTFYMIQYDMGMFSSRVTNVKKENQENLVKQKNQEMQEKSLTGVPMSPDVNYLYPAELEYIVSGHYSSKDNLTETRNNIVMFRFVMNFLSTYLADEINSAIQTISKAASVANPVLGMAVSGALRMAVAGMESGEDWKQLKERETVTVLKKKLKEFTCADIGALLGVEITSDKPDGFGLDYEQYLQIMMLVMTSPQEIAARTANLVTLNVNEVRQHSPDALSSLDFRLEDAVTAVNAACSIHLDFAVMPDGFAEKVTDKGTYEELIEFEKNRYKFTVTRGY